MEGIVAVQRFAIYTRGASYHLYICTLKIYELDYTNETPITALKQFKYHNGDGESTEIPCGRYAPERIDIRFSKGILWSPIALDGIALMSRLSNFLTILQKRLWNECPMYRHFVSGLLTDR